MEEITDAEEEGIPTEKELSISLDSKFEALFLWDGYSHSILRITQALQRGSNLSHFLCALRHPLQLILLPPFISVGEEGVGCC